jgi:hypothetical protein
MTTTNICIENIETFAEPSLWERGFPEKKIGTELCKLVKFAEIHRFFFENDPDESAFRESCDWPVEEARAYHLQARIDLEWVSKWIIGKIGFEMAL